MYFCHSFYVKPSDPGIVLATTRYGDQEFCSALGRHNIFACQCHPERSGPPGLAVYRNLARILDD
jgi:glutamine amidotransferase